jgi:hypothetical protein
MVEGSGSGRRRGRPTRWRYAAAIRNRHAMPSEPSNSQLPRNNTPTSGKPAKINASASAARHHRRAWEAHPSAMAPHPPRHRPRGLACSHPYRLVQIWVTRATALRPLSCRALSSTAKSRLSKREPRCSTWAAENQLKTEKTKAAEPCRKQARKFAELYLNSAAYEHLS